MLRSDTGQFTLYHCFLPHVSLVQTHSSFYSRDILHPHWICQRQILPGSTWNLIRLQEVQLDRNFPLSSSNTVVNWRSSSLCNILIITGDSSGSWGYSVERAMYSSKFLFNCFEFQKSIRLSELEYANETCSELFFLVTRVLSFEQHHYSCTREFHGSIDRSLHQDCISYCRSLVSYCVL